jgi:hypothetical protein
MPIDDVILPIIPIDDYIHSSTTHQLLWLLEYIKHAGYLLIIKREMEKPLIWLY